MNLPEDFITKMQSLLKEEYKDYIDSLEQKRAYGLRCNTLKISNKELESKNIGELSCVPWCQEGFYYDEKKRLSKHPYHHAGLYYIQEPSAMAPGAFFPVEPGHTVLDICGAPGGKSTQLAAKMAGEGILFSNDISITRTNALLKNIELFGIKNAIVLSESPEKLSKLFSGFFDRILIDAPCSGEGMFRKEPDVMKSWGEKMSAFCYKAQREILNHSSMMLKKGGMLLYSTCTFSPEENEQVIQDFLNEHSDFSIEPLPKMKGFEGGRPEWIENGRPDIGGCLRLFPHKIKGEGHFLALLKKQGAPQCEISVKYETNSQDARLSYFLDFCKQNVPRLKIKGMFRVIGDNLYLLPENTPYLGGLRIVRSGWFLGVFKKNRFEPSQGFAMGLKKEEAAFCVDMPLCDENVIRYLKGETIETQESKEGWCIVCVDGYPLGWAKAQRGRLKNKYFPGWKWE